MGLVAAGVALLAGCVGGQPVPEPTELPPLGWEPDVVVSRDFPDADGRLVPCTVAIRVTTASAGTVTAEDFTALLDARTWASARDWDTIEVSIDDVPAEMLAVQRDRGTPESMILASALADAISDELSSVVTTGLTLEGRTTCDV